MEGYKTHSHSHSRAFSKKAYNGSNGFFTAYDDVFGGSQKFVVGGGGANGGVTAFAPRAEDYTEIFGTFRSSTSSSSSRISSIPILDLPPVDDSIASFDVNSSKFDYRDVFGGFEFVEIGVPFDELFRQSDGGVDYSSDEAWTPVGAESLSEESDPSAPSESNNCVPNGNLDDRLENKQFNVNCHKVNPGEDMSNMFHVDPVSAVPGFTYLVDDVSSLPKNGEERSRPGFSGHTVSRKDTSENDTRGRHLKKTLSHPSHAGPGISSFESTQRAGRDYVNGDFDPDSGFISLSEINLRTEPSYLPPPSRPPPVATDRREGSNRSSSEKASNGYASETTDGSSSDFFDAEVDASSSAAASAAAMKDAMEKAQARLKSAKEFMDRKKDGLQNRKNQAMNKETDEGDPSMVSHERAFEDDRRHGSLERGHNKIKEGDVGISKTVDFRPQSRMVSDEHAWENVRMHDSREREHNQRKKSSQGKSLKVSDKHASKKENAETNSTVVSDECNVENDSRPNHEKENNGRVISGKRSEAVSTAPQDLPNPCGDNETVSVAVEPARRNNALEEDTGQWKEASEYFELVNNGTPRAFEPLTDMKNGGSDANGHHNFEKDGASEVHQVLEQHDVKPFSSMKSNESDEDEHEDESPRHVCQPINRWKLKATKAVSRHEYHAKMEKVAQEVHEKEAQSHVEVPDRLKDGCESSDQMIKPKASYEQQTDERILDQGPQNANKRDAPMQQEGEERRKEGLAQEENANKLEESGGMKVKESCGRNERHEGTKVALEKEGNQQACKKEKIQNNMLEIHEPQENMKGFENTECKESEMTWRELNTEMNFDGELSGICNSQVDARKPLGTEESCVSENPFGDATGLEGCQKIDAVATNPSQERLDETCESVTHSMDFEGFENNDNESNLSDDVEQREIPKESVHAGSTKETQEARMDSVWVEEPTSLHESKGAIDMEFKDQEPLYPMGIGVNINGEHHKTSNRLFDLDLNDFGQDKVAEMHKEVHGYRNNSDRTEASDAGNNGRNDVGKVQDDASQHSENGIDAAGESPSTSSDCSRSSDACTGNRQTVVGDNKVRGPCSAEGLSQYSESGIDAASEPLSTSKDCTRSYDACAENGQTIVNDSEVPEPGYKKEDHHVPVGGTNESYSDQGRNKHRSLQTERATIGRAEKMSAEARQPVMSERKESFRRPSQPPRTNQGAGRKGTTDGDCFTSEENDKADRLSRDMELEKERLRKLEEEREREREREKDRMAYTEARERTERATSEARQRAMAEARERLEKACAEARGKSFMDKSSAEARLRAERAAVERATAEARERAREKAMAERAIFEERERMERSSSEKFSSSFREMGPRQSSLPSNFQNYDDGLGESTQRCKARLERHRRTVDRVAKALAEKNMRDLIAQREKAERNRMAETLDADIKRWSNGKERNLRALLSTLQYILGPDSGWQPIPLTDVITSAAVKKAYRKATLCVHPDKLQQRGASIQQKYICEKVFDLLKDAWNRFNSEER